MDGKNCWNCRHYALPIGEDGVYSFCEKEQRVLTDEEVVREHDCSENDYYHCGHA
jgi:hypothetical protein